MAAQLCFDRGREPSQAKIAGTGDAFAGVNGLDVGGLRQVVLHREQLQRLCWDGPRLPFQENNGSRVASKGLARERIHLCMNGPNGRRIEKLVVGYQPMMALINNPNKPRSGRKSPIHFSSKNHACLQIT